MSTAAQVWATIGIIIGLTAVDFCAQEVAGAWRKFVKRLDRIESKLDEVDKKLTALR